MYVLLFLISVFSVLCLLCSLFHGVWRRFELRGSYGYLSCVLKHFWWVLTLSAWRCWWSCALSFSAQGVMDCCCVFLSRFNDKTTEIWSFYWKCISFLWTQLHIAHGQLLVWTDCSLTGCSWGVVVFELIVTISPCDPSISSSVASHIGYTRFCSMLNSGTLKLVAARSRMLLTWSVISLEC